VCDVIIEFLQANSERNEDTSNSEGKNTDNKAKEIAGPGGNVFSDAKRVAEILFEELLTQPLNREVFEKICEYSYILANSTAMLTISNRDVLHNVRQQMQKLGFYSWGIVALHEATSKTNMSLKWQSLIVEAIMPPPLDQPVITEDWYRVIEAVYARRKRKELPVTRGTILGRYGGLSAFNTVYDRQFFRHAEITLIDALTARGRCPAEG
jgi:hypothetical protein